MQAIINYLKCIIQKKKLKPKGYKFIVCIYSQYVHIIHILLQFAIELKSDYVAFNRLHAAPSKNNIKNRN